MRAAFLGTGKMASAMARRAHAAGHEVVLWNRTPARARAVGVGRVEESPAAATAAAEVVLLALTDAGAVVDVLGQVGGAASGRALVDMTTAGMRVFEEMTRPLAERGAALVVAPIFGSVGAVESGGARLLVGEDADEAALERARPVLESFATIGRIARTEQAVGVKLLVNAMLFISSLAAGELVATGSRTGIPAEDALGGLVRLAPHLEVRRHSYVEGVHEPVTFRLADAVKDLDLALEHFRRSGASMPVTALTRELYAELVESLGDAEMSAVVERYR